MVLAHAVKKKRVARSAGALGVQLGEDTARAMIVQGAARVFAKRGLRLASVEDILQTAKVSRRTFYRFYDNKEDVLAALYRLGTEGLLESCRLASKESITTLQLIVRCIDAHLLNARGLGRLVFVLGGEAQRYESPLHTRRTEVHDTLATLFAESCPEPRPDVLLFRAIVLAIEGITRHTLEQGDEGRDVRPEALARARRVMLRVAAAALAGEGPGVPPLP